MQMYTLYLIWIFLSFWEYMLFPFLLNPFPHFAALILPPMVNVQYHPGCDLLMCSVAGPLVIGVTRSHKGCKWEPHGQFLITPLIHFLLYFSCFESRISSFYSGAWLGLKVLEIFGHSVVFRSLVEVPCFSVSSKSCPDGIMISESCQTPIFFLI